MRRVVERLNIAVHGDRLHKARTVEIVYRERMEREIGFQNIDIPEPKQTRTGTFRATQNTVEASPNAPLLKRVVQNPFALEIGYFKRANLPRVKIQPREKIVFPDFVREQLQKETKIRTIRPMEMHFRAQSPIVPTVESWLKLESNTQINR